MLGWTYNSFNDRWNEKMLHEYSYLRMDELKLARVKEEIKSNLLFSNIEYFNLIPSFSLVDTRVEVLIAQQRKYSFEVMAEIFEQLVKKIPREELSKWTKESFLKHFSILKSLNSWEVEGYIEGEIFQITKIKDE